MGIETIAGLALSAAGTGVSIANARATQARMDNIVRQQLAAAQQFQQEATPEFQRSLGISGPRSAQQSLASGEQQALAGYQRLQSMPAATSGSPLLGDTLTNVRTQARINQSNQAQAALQGYGNLTLQQFLANQQANQNLGVISGLAGSRAAVTPYLLQGAQQRGQDLASIGSLLGTAGSLAGVYGGLYPYLSTPATQPPVGRPGSKGE